MTRLCSSAALALLALAAPAAALDGRYDVSGNDATYGPYQGELRVVAAGPHYELSRVVRYQRPVAGATGPVTVAWHGTGTRQGADLVVTYVLRRMDWVTEAGGLQRTVADQQPRTVLGRYRPDPAGGLAGSVTAPAVGHLPAVVLNEALRRTGAAPAGALLPQERAFSPIHGAPAPWLKSLLFSIFADYHRLPPIAPHAGRADFQGAVHYEIQDRAGFDWLRANPGELLLIDKPIDAISLTEAELRRRAYGQRLIDKASLADLEAVTRYRDDTGLLAFGLQPNASGGYDKHEDMSTCLWSGTYAYGQALRYQVTGDPVALANVEQIAGLLCDLVEIDPRPEEFARSLRPIGRAPLSGSWHAGTGQYAHLAWHDRGNNDMLKGLWIGFLGAWDVLPQGHPLRGRIERCVRELADHWLTRSSQKRRDSPGNQSTTNMLAYWITGERKYHDAYQRALRKPLALLDLATGGTFAVYGIVDSSGTHLGIVGTVVRLELAQRLGSRWAPVFRHSLRMNWRFLKNYRATLYAIAMAGYQGDAAARDKARWELAEFCYPKPQAGIDRTLDPTWSFSPFPGLPWKLDWMTNAGRRSSLYSYPVFMRTASNYTYRSSAFNKGGPATPWEFHGGDYLFAYWMARKLGVIGPTD